MAERRGPVIPPGVASAKRQVSGRKLLLWLAGVVVLAAVAFVVVRFVGAGDGGSQPTPAQQTLPPDPEPPPTTTTTTAPPPPTTTTPPVTDAVDESPPAAETDGPQSSSQEDDSPADEPAAQTSAAVPPAFAELLPIRDAGDFASVLTLRCADYDVYLEWHVSPPFEIPPQEEGEPPPLQRDRERTPAPFGSQGSLRVEFETFVPPDVDPEVSGDLPPDGTDESDPAAEPDVDPDTSGDEPPDDPAEGDPDEGEPAAESDAAQEAPPEPESVLVLEATSISGRHTEDEGTGGLSGRLRHHCPVSSLERFAEWKLTVEGHGEVRWDLTLSLASGDADGAASGTFDEMIEQIIDEAFEEAFEELLGEGAGEVLDETGAGTDQ